MVQGVSDMYNLFRAAQTAYPEEERLVEANAFSREFLMDALTKNKGGADKWSLKKDLSGEVEYTLKYPDHKSLKRMEIRHYLDKYGPEDAWIGKSIYRLPLVNNHDYLTLAKADFNLCQKLHQKELRQILRWMSNSGLPSSWSFRQKIVMLYALFSAEVWEAEFAPLRIAVGQCMFIATAMYQLVQLSSLTDVLHFVDAIRRWDPSRVPYELPPKFSSCFLLLFNTLNASAEHLSENTGLIQQLVQIWQRLMNAFLVEAESRASTTITLDKNCKTTFTTSGLEAIAMSSVLMSGEISSPHFLIWMEKDCSYLRTASEAVKLAQTMAMNKGHATIGPVYSNYLQDHKNASMEEAEMHFTSLKEQIQKELNWQQGQRSTVPLIVKRVLFGFTKVANFCYSGSEQELHFELRRLLLNSVQ